MANRTPTFGDLETWAHACFSSAGYVPHGDQLDWSGKICYAGTSEEPRGTFARYMLHVDFPPNLTIWNHREPGSKQTFMFESSAMQEMSEAERKALAERIRREREAKEKALAEERRKAAERARQIYASLSPAKADNPYLKRKCISPVQGLKQDKDGRLVMPLMAGRKAEIVSLEYIAGDGEKRFLRGAQKAGCYFPIPAVDQKKDGALLVGEGLATVQSACMATGFAGLVAMDAGNFIHVAEFARSLYPTRLLICLADNDCVDKNGNQKSEDRNTGIQAARAAAEATGSRSAICPALDGKATDFNDLHVAKGLEAVKSVIEESISQPEWQPPVSFTTYDLPKLDTKNLPPVLGDYCEGLAEETQTPVELVLSLSLAAVATAAQASYRVRIRSGYTELLGVYTLCPLDPSNRKSGVAKAVTAPLIEWEREMEKRLEPEIRQARSRRLTLEKAIEHKRADAAKAKSASKRDELQHEIESLEMDLPEIPIKPRLLTDSVTPEALAVLMSEQCETMAIISPEGGIFDVLSGLYSRGVPNLDLFLKAYTGDSYRVDRKQSSSILLDCPRLVIGITSQPFTLINRTAADAFRGRGLDGRFLYFMPESLLGHRKGEPELMDPQVKSRFFNKIKSLLPESWGKERPLPIDLELSPEAYSLWLNFYENVENELAEGGEFEHMRDWAGKLAGNVGRIAGLFHLLTHDRPELMKVTPETMSQAIYVGAFCAEHAKAAYDLMGTDKTIEGAKRILSWIRRKGADKFETQECWQGNKSFFDHSGPLKESLQELVERNFIRELQTHNSRPTAGRPKGATYLVNPLALKG